MLPITQGLLTSRRNRPALRDMEEYTIKEMRAVIVHWTANTGKGANAWANRNYFNNTDRFASAHYCVDDGVILQCLPDEEVGYHVGGNNYRAIGKYVMGDSPTPNYHCVGIEMCVNMDGDWNKTYENSVELTRHLLNKFNMSVFSLFRHFDITGKDCPKMMIEEEAWQKFRRDVNKGLKLEVKEVVRKGVVTSAGALLRKGMDDKSPIGGKMELGTTFEIYDFINGWYRIGDELWIHGNDATEQLQLQAIVETDDGFLNVRRGPSKTFEAIGRIKNGTQVIIYEKRGSWCRIAPQEEQWVHQIGLSFEAPKKGVITSNQLFVKGEPRAEADKIAVLKKDEIVTVLSDNDFPWLRIDNPDGWIHSNYVKIIG